MKLRDILVLSALMIFTLAFRTGTGYGYTIDGQVDDWGVDLYASGAVEKSYLDTELPSGGLNIDVVTEDNASSNVYGWVYVGPGSSYGGKVKVNGEYKYMNSNYLALSQTEWVD
ncbi:MAG TPA: hypothetical protein ENN18_00575 [Proteobacteria bacterium]|nr:hypothetical protein [Pseudomonadota bacterium]